MYYLELYIIMHTHSKLSIFQAQFWAGVWWHLSDALNYTVDSRESWWKCRKGFGKFKNSMTHGPGSESSHVSITHTNIHMHTRKHMHAHRHVCRGLFQRHSQEVTWTHTSLWRSPPEGIRQSPRAGHGHQCSSHCLFPVEYVTGVTASPS